MVPVAGTLLALTTGTAPAVAAAALGGAAWLLMTAMYGPIPRSYRQPPIAAFALPFTAVLYLLMTVDSARLHRAGQAPRGKGGRTPAPATRPARSGRRPEDRAGTGMRTGWTA